MEVYKFNKKINFKETTVLLGSFESFHIGHNELYKKAKTYNNPVGILIYDKYTNFSNHITKEFYSLKARLNNLSKLGFSFAIVATFDSKFKNMTAKDFIDTLTTTCNVKRIVCGKDLNIGRNREWNANCIKEYFDETHIVDILKINNSKISTSKIIENIIVGEVNFNNKLLINNWEFLVRKDDEKLIIQKDQLLPHCGVYYGEITYKNLAIPALLRVSFNEQLFYSTIDKLKVDHFEIVSVSFIREKRLIIKSTEDIILDQELKQLQYFFSERIVKKPKVISKKPSAE